MLRRRAFVKTALACLGTASLGTGAWTHPLSAISPVQRNGDAKLKFSMAAYSYRDLLLGDSKVMSLFEFVEDCAKMGLAGTELTSYYFPEAVDTEYLIRLKKRCFELGLDVSGTAVGNDFGVSDPALRAEQIAQVKTWIERAAILGAPVIRIFAGQVPQGSSVDETHRRMVAGIEECCDYAGKQGIFLALENHGGPTSDLAGVLRFVNDVQSPWFAINMDTGNFHSDDIYGDLARIAPYTVNVQVKVATSGPDGVSHPTDYGRLAKVLRDSGYRGYVVLEFEADGDPRVECPKAMAAMRTAMRNPK